MLKKFMLVSAALTMAACAGAPADRGEAVEAVAEEPRGVTLPEFEQVMLPNGMRVLLMEKRDVPMVAFEAVIEGGAMADPSGKEGTAALVAELLRKGAGGRSAPEFAEAVENVGGELSTAASKEALLVSGEFMAQDAGLMVELLGDILMDPALARAEFEKSRTRSIQQLQAMKDTNLRGLVGLYGNAFLFGEHPYGRATSGTEAGLAQVEYADIRRYYIEHIGADRTTLAVVGDFDSAAMKRKLEQRLGGWRQAAGTAPRAEPAAVREGTRVLLVDKQDATQTYFYIGNIGVARDYPERAALDLVNTVFGGRFTSMLNTRLRVESGLTYGAGSRTVRYRQPGALAITSFTRTETTVEAIDMALATLSDLHLQGLSEEQLDSAKAYVLGQFPPRLETGPALAGRIADLAFYGLGREDVDNYADAIDAVDTEAARRVIEAVYPQRENLVFVLIGNADAIRDEVAKYGPVTEIEITEPTFTP